MTDNSINYDNFSLDELEDLPGFVTFPTGAFHVKLDKGLLRKKIGEHEGVEAAMTLVNVLEIPGDADKESVKAGDICSTIFMLDNEMGRGKLKEFCAPISEAINSKSFGDIMKASVGMELVITGKRTVSSKDADKHYFNVTKVATV